MKRTTIVALLASAAVAFAASPAFGQVTSTSTGGAGGSGGSAAGGTATGGTSTNTNNTTGGTSSATGGTSSATGGTSSSAGGSSNIGSATSNSQAADVSVNYITPAGAAGVNGLAPGVDPGNNHVVTDNNVHYSGTTKIKNTPDVSIGGPASGPCNGASGGLGVGIPGLAVGANVSTVDKGCEARETARVAAMLGRMDVANAILENMDVVVAALRARSDRDALAAVEAEHNAAQAKAAVAANAAVAAAVRDNAETQQAARNREAQAMRLQQQAGTEALARQATMAKVNDTLSFTGKLTQGDEKTPQQQMVENLAAKQAMEKAAAAPVAQAVQPPAQPPQQPAQPQQQPVPQQSMPRQAAQAQPVKEPVTQRSPDPVQAAADQKPGAPGLAHVLVAKKSDAAVAPSLMAAAKPPESAPKPAAGPSRRDADDRKRTSKHDDPDDAVRFALGLNDHP